MAGGSIDQQKRLASVSAEIEFVSALRNLFQSAADSFNVNAFGGSLPVVDFIGKSDSVLDALQSERSELNGEVNG